MSTLGRTLEADKAGMLEAIQEVLDEAHQRAQTSRRVKDQVRASGYADGVRRVMNMIRDWDIKPDGWRDPADLDPVEVPEQMLEDAVTAFEAETFTRTGIIAALTAANIWGDGSHLSTAMHAFNSGPYQAGNVKEPVRRALAAVLEVVNKKEGL